MEETISGMKQYLMKQYPGMKWHSRVQNMRPEQVIAVYHSVMERNKKKKKEAKLLAKQNDMQPQEQKKENEYHQIDIFEYLASVTNNTTKIKVDL